MKHEITAKRLQTAMYNIGVSAQELASKSGVAKSSISQYLHGSHKPSDVSSSKLSAVLNVNPLWLMGFNVSSENNQIEQQTCVISPSAEDNSINQTLGSIIKEYRTKYDLSMDAFSVRSGISKSYIALLEKNKHPKTGKGITPSIQCIRQAAMGMNMEFNTLFEILNEKNTEGFSRESNSPDPLSHTACNITYSKLFSLPMTNEEDMIEKFRKLDQYGQDTVCIILEREYRRCIGYDSTRELRKK